MFLTPRLRGSVCEDVPHLHESGGVDVRVLAAEAALAEAESLRAAAV